MDAVNRTLGLQLLIEMSLENPTRQLILLSPQARCRVSTHASNRLAGVESGLSRLTWYSSLRREHHAACDPSAGVQDAADDPAAVSSRRTSVPSRRRCSWHKNCGTRPSRRALCRCIRCSRRAPMRPPRDRMRAASRLARETAGGTGWRTSSSVRGGSALHTEVIED